MKREKNQEEDITPSELRRRLLRDFRKEAMRNKFEARRKKYDMEERQNLENLEEENAMKQEEMPPNQQEYLAYLMKHNLKHHIDDLQLPQSHQEQYPPHKIYFQHKGMIIFDEILGKGSYGIVRSGINKHTGEKIAAKQMDYFQKNQLKCLKELDSQYIIKIIDYFQYNQKCYIIFEYCQGNLKEELKKCNYDIEKALSYFEQIIFGIDLLQSKNIIHRDLKFQNILVKDGKAKISDFGLAKYLGNHLQVESRQCGTKYTMAPEIYFSNPKRAYYTRKADIWAIGVMLHEILYRMHPFRGMADRLNKGARVPIQRKFGILDRMIDKCLVRRPSQRINWNEFMNLFDCYRQKKLIYCQKQSRSYVTFLIHPKKEEKKEYHSQGEDLRRNDSMNERKQRTPLKINKLVKKKFEQRRANENFQMRQIQNCKHYGANRVQNMKNSPCEERIQQRPIQVDQLAIQPLKFNEIETFPLSKQQVKQQFNISQMPIPIHQVIILLLMILIAASVAVKMMVFLI